MFSDDAQPTKHNLKARAAAVIEAASSGATLAPEYGAKGSILASDVAKAFRAARDWGRRAEDLLEGRVKPG